MDSEQPDSTEQSLPDPLPELTDAELYLALKAGQTNALGVLYDRHAALVYGIALQVTDNRQEAEDLTQDVFLQLVRSSSYDPRRGSLRTFLAILTRSRAIDRIRSRKSALAFLGRWKSNTGSESLSRSPLEFVAQTEQSEEVQTALSQLPPNEQQILRLAYYDGLSQSQIAAQLAIPLGTVKTRSRQGLLKLRQSLANYNG